MAKSFNQMMRDIQEKEKVQRARETYIQPLRPRSTVFHTKKEYSRQRAKLETRKAVANW